MHVRYISPNSAPEDYSALVEDLVFQPAGLEIQCANITINSDIIVETAEAFNFTISPSQADRAVNLVEPSYATVTIVDREDSARR